MKKNITLITLLVALAVSTRTIFHLGTNIELVTATSLAAGYFIKEKKYVFVVPFLIMLISDLIIGNTLIFIFTWSAFLLTPTLGMLIKNKKIQKRLSDMPAWIRILILSEGAGILSTIIFFLWTNLGVVLTTNMYAKTFSGLMQSYINALPFLRPQLYANLLLVPGLFIVLKLMRNLSWKSNIKEQCRYE